MKCSVGPVGCFFFRRDGRGNAGYNVVTYRKRGFGLRVSLRSARRYVRFTGVLGPGASRQLHDIVSVGHDTRHTSTRDHRGELPARRDPPRSASTSPPVRGPLSSPTDTTDVLNITLTSTPAVPIGRLGRTHWPGGPSSLAGKFDFGRFAAATRACLPSGTLLLVASPPLHFYYYRSILFIEKSSLVYILCT